MADKITADEVRDLLEYKEQTGALVWKWRKGSSRDIKRWNNRYAWTTAGSVVDGYTYILIHKRRYAAHRIIWLWVYGEWPSPTIDHINGNKSDNRLCNLREASKSQNRWNIKLDSVRGYYKTKRGKWHVAINKEKKKIHIGYFDTEEEASVAYREAKKTYHNEFSGYE